MDKIEAIINKEILCQCGKHHFIPLKGIDLDFTMQNIAQACSSYFSGKNIMVVSDVNTDEVQGSLVFDSLLEADYNVQRLVFEDKKVIPNEKAVGTIMMSITEKLDGMIAVGSGTITDLVRMVVARLGVPFISIPTAPSMDGYASGVSSLIKNNRKTTFSGVAATVIIGDINVIKEAPIELVQAGFGDIIGKKISMSDWVLSVNMTDEYFCEYAANLIGNSTNLCIENVENIINREEQGIRSLMEALILSGLAISIVGDSRPASGTEHLLAHYFESSFIKQGKKPIFHGTAVAVGCFYASLLYQYVLETNEFQALENSKQIKESILKIAPKPEEVEEWLEKIGLSKYPLDYEIDRELLKEAFLLSRFTRKRYTLLNFAAELGVLEKATDSILDQLYQE
ncbi:hypothetical protein BKP37_14175 [Anaerobacillus alkalilacustris]|uniref:Glycerol-1-phosphate dehydrogenase n=1 Tax=Anaerobacillus alkalilacustris TaxID=393763 RepID=A0A1S2LJ63_9BACI|nr:sn-glycerol-1-phosphate dehydrogenase [Anaerobacillus alkalilacustris]OIJ12569.1 hypothetical protein BKP37_14175 [Anaerobacillus alkalilacustris]